MSIPSLAVRPNRHQLSLQTANIAWLYGSCQKAASAVLRESFHLLHTPCRLWLPWAYEHLRAGRHTSYKQPLSYHIILLYHQAVTNHANILFSCQQACTDRQAAWQLAVNRLSARPVCKALVRVHPTGSATIIHLKTHQNLDDSKLGMHKHQLLHNSSCLTIAVCGSGSLHVLAAMPSACMKPQKWCC